MPKWVKNERERKERDTSYSKGARALALHMLLEAGEIDTSNKSELARRLGTSRYSIDRDLLVIEDAKQIANEYRRENQ